MPLCQVQGGHLLGHLQEQESVHSPKMNSSSPPQGISSIYFLQSKPNLTGKGGAFAKDFDLLLRETCDHCLLLLCALLYSTKSISESLKF